MLFHRLKTNNFWSFISINNYTDAAYMPSNPPNRLFTETKIVFDWNHPGQNQNHQWILLPSQSKKFICCKAEIWDIFHISRWVTDDWKPRILFPSQTEFWHQILLVFISLLAGFQLFRQYVSTATPTTEGLLHLVS